MGKMKDLLDEFTVKLIKEQLIINNGDLVKTAHALGIPMKQLYIFRGRFPELEKYVTCRKTGPVSKEKKEGRRSMGVRFPDEV